jgi:pre-rRNA-processing protein TSR1
MEIKVVGKENEDSEGSAEAESDDDEEFDINKTFMDDPNKISQKHQKYTDLESRAREDMDFPDEVDTPLDVEARKRFIKYRGIKSIKNCSWDPYENLPTEYSKIWRFQNFNNAQKDSIQLAIDEGLPLNGTFIRLVLSYDDELKIEELADKVNGKAFVLSTLFPHECKLSIMHFKIQRKPENEEAIPSKHEVLLHCGFRTFTVRPLFS